MNSGFPRNNISLVLTDTEGDIQPATAISASYVCINYKRKCCHKTCKQHQIRKKKNNYARLGRFLREKKVINFLKALVQMHLQTGSLPENNGNCFIKPFPGLLDSVWSLLVFSPGGTLKHEILQVFMYWLQKETPTENRLSGLLHLRETKIFFLNW